MNEPYLRLIGLAQRARKIALGEETIVKAIQQRKAHLVLLAADIGEQTRKKLTDKCTFYNIPYVIVDDRETLSQAIGSSGRVAIAIVDQGFARKLASLLKV